MATPDEPKKCPRCGAVLAPDAPSGLCLQCLARLGVTGPSAAPGDTLVLPPEESLSLPETIRYFGDYELLEEVGRGGMGVVYRARQVSLNREVAVKMIRSGPLASEEFLRRFRLEAETIAQFHHANIVTLYEVGEHQGQPYFSMEFVAGPTLASLCRQAPLPARQAALWVAVIARAVQHAHDHGVIHRDLKPANVLIDQRQADPLRQPRVTDFGIVKRLDDKSPSTVTGQTMGTPEFMPPEQIRAQRGTVTVRSDVYSLGAILYNLLTGRPPFQGAAIAEIFQAVLEREPTAPRQINAAVPRDLEAICLRCLDKTPERRYATAAELAEDLERWLEGKPIHARPVRLPERAWMWAKRKPVIAALSVFCVLSLLGGMAGVLLEWRIAETHRREAEERRSEAENGRRKLRAYLVDYQAREATRQLDANQSYAGVATLAKSLRIEPHYRVTATRLASALTYRNLALPSTPTLADDSQIFWAGFTPDGMRALTLTSDSKLRVWYPASGQPVSPPLEQPGEVGNLAFSTDGAALLVISEGGTLLLRNPQNGAVLETIPVPGLTPNAALSPDGTTIAAGLTNGTILLLDRRPQPAARREILAHQKAITWIEFSRDGRFLVTAADDGFARVWAAGSNFTRVAELPHNSPITQASPNTDGQRVATVGGVEVKLWEIPSGRSLTNLLLPALVTAPVAFSPDSARLALGLQNGNVRLLDAQTGRELLRRDVHPKQVHAVDFSPDGQFAVSASDDATVQVWDVHSGDLVCEPIPHANSATAAQFSPDGLQLITATLSTSAHLWDVRPGAAVPVSIREPDSVRVVAFSASPVELLTVSSRGAVRAWNPHTGTLRRTIREPGDPMFWATFDEPRRRVLLAQRDARAFVLDLASAQSTPLAATVSAQIVAHAFSPDGTRAAVGDGAITYVCEAASGRRVLLPLECRGVGGTFPHEAYSLCFSPDGRQLLVACYNLHARLWDLQTGAAQADFLHAGPPSPPPSSRPMARAS